MLPPFARASCRAAVGTASRWTAPALKTTMYDPGIASSAARGDPRDSQTPNFKLQKKSQASNPNSDCDVAALELGHWCFFGIWSLVIGTIIRISAPPSD